MADKKQDYAQILYCAHQNNSGQIFNYYAIDEDIFFCSESCQ